jgi:hypothetical protein
MKCNNRALTLALAMIFAVHGSMIFATSPEGYGSIQQASLEDEDVGCLSALFGKMHVGCSDDASMDAESLDSQSSSRYARCYESAKVIMKHLPRLIRHAVELFGLYEGFNYIVHLPHEPTVLKQKFYNDLVFCYQQSICDNNCDKFSVMERCIDILTPGNNGSIYVVDECAQQGLIVGVIMIVLVGTLIDMASGLVKIKKLNEEDKLALQRMKDHMVVSKIIASIIEAALIGLGEAGRNTYVGIDFSNASKNCFDSTNDLHALISCIPFPDNICDIQRGFVAAEIVMSADIVGTFWWLLYECCKYNPSLNAMLHLFRP